jgi:hypothetical protein
LWLDPDEQNFCTTRTSKNQPENDLPADQQKNDLTQEQEQETESAQEQNKKKKK